MEEVPTAANIMNYTKIVKEKSVLRKLVDIGTNIVEMAYEGYEDVDTILDKSEGLIFKISESKETKDVTPLSELVVQEFDRLESVFQNKGATTGISSGFIHFDEMTSGFPPVRPCNISSKA